jgi:hypothetical protein
MCTMFYGSRARNWHSAISGMVRGDRAWRVGDGVSGAGAGLDFWSRRHTGQARAALPEE